ncbi:transposase family protein [Streptomyces sp. NPDC007369]|uniref:transposase family protein n=1 Tax=Streptomyces sp. NPDC007369 TaxID=3154589 RepID=UPI0033D06A2A
MVGEPPLQAAAVARHPQAPFLFRANASRSSPARSFPRIRQQPFLHAAYVARGCSINPDVRMRPLAEVIDHLGATGRTGIIDGTEIRVRRPAVGRRDRDKFSSGKSKQNAVKAMVVTDQDGRVLFCSPTTRASCADITRARRSGLVNCSPTDPRWRFLPMLPTTTSWRLRPADTW